MPRGDLLVAYHKKPTYTVLIIISFAGNPFRIPYVVR